MRLNRHRSVFFIMLFVWVVLQTGCFNRDNGVSTVETSSSSSSNKANVVFKLMLPEEQSSSSLSPAIRANPTLPAIVTFKIKLLNYGNSQNPITTLVKKVVVKDDTASATFQNIPLGTMLGQIHISNGRVASYSDFHGAIELTSGLNTVEMVPVGCLTTQDVVSEAVETIVASSTLFARIKQTLVLELKNIVSSLTINSNTISDDIITSFTQRNALPKATISEINYIKAVSMPLEIAEMGAVTALLAKNTPQISASLLKASITILRLSIMASTVVSKDIYNVYTLFNSNYEGAVDYDPSDSKGTQTIKFKYLGPDNYTQATPGPNTVKFEMEAFGTSDYDLFKYENATGKYIAVNADSSQTWLNTSKYSLSVTEASTVIFANSGKDFTYQRTGNFIIDAATGKAISGFMTDTLIDGMNNLSAHHTISNGSCSSKYSVNGTEETLVTQFPVILDETKTYQWVNPISFRSEYLSVSFNGKGVTLAGVDNDRLNMLYLQNPFTFNTPEEFENSTYARIFRHACNNDATVDMIVDVAKQSYPNDIESQLNYCLGFETKGLIYLTDDQNFGEGEYVCLPRITLYKQSGDCEDRAILLGALFHKMGLDVSLILLKGAAGREGHAMVGICLPAELETLATTGSVYYSYNGKKYYCFEATNFIPLNSIKEAFEQKEFSLMAIIPSNANAPVLRGTIREIFQEKN